MVMKKLTEIGLALLLQNSAMSTWGLSQEDMVCLTDPSLYSVAIPRHNEMGGAGGEKRYHVRLWYKNLS